MPAAFIAVVAATAGIIVWSWGIVSATGDPVWVPLLFVPALALLPVVIYTGRARVWLAVVAWFPIIGGIAHGTGIVVIMTCG